MDCPNCGAECPDNDVFCWTCGYRLKPYSSQQTTDQEASENGTTNSSETHYDASEASRRAKRKNHQIKTAAVYDKKLIRVVKDSDCKRVYYQDG